MSQNNVSTIFLLPGTEIKEETKRKFRQNGFINTFLTCDQLNYPYEVIYLVFKPEQFDLEFYALSQELQANPNYIETIDVGNRKVVMVYKIPRRFKKDYHLFVEGRYSKLSNDYKRLFVMEDYKRDSKGNPIRENGRWVKEPSKFHHIFNRTQYLKERLKLRIYGDDEDNAHTLDSVELYEKQDPEKESLELGIEIW